MKSTTRLSSQRSPTSLLWKKGGSKKRLWLHSLFPLISRSLRREKPNCRLRTCTSQLAT